MKTYQETTENLERFHLEREEFRLLYRCKDCVHVDSASGLCSLGFPNEELCEHNGFMNHKGQFIFCKYFEAS